MYKKENMDSSHIERLIKLCGGLPEDKLMRMRAGLDGFFEENPIPDEVWGELRRIRGVSGGYKDFKDFKDYNEYKEYKDYKHGEMGYGLFILINSVVIGIVIWYLVTFFNEEQRKDDAREKKESEQSKYMLRYVAEEEAKDKAKEEEKVKEKAKEEEAKEEKAKEEEERAADMD